MGVFKKKEFTEKSIQKALHYSFLSESTKKYEMYNMFVYDWESDYLTITRSGYAYECEIKISRSDFFNDAKKLNKHLILEGKKEKPEPNYFYYAVPKDLIKVEEVPEYAGLIYIINDYNSTIVKEAPKLNKEKQDVEKLNLIDKFYYRLLDREFKLEKNDISELNKKIKLLEKDCSWYDNELSLRNNEIDELRFEIKKLKDKG